MWGVIPVFQDKEAMRLYNESMERERRARMEQTMNQGTGTQAVQVAGGVIEAAAEQEKRKEITLKFSKKMVGEPFMSKKGVELVSIKIPNADPEDKTPWASFVVGANRVHEDKFGKGMWTKLPEDGETTVKKPVCIGEGEDGKRIWEDQKTKVSNIDLKSMVEFYKTKDQKRDSVLGDLSAKVAEAASRPVTPKPAKVAEAAR